MRNTKDHVLVGLETVRAEVDSARIRMWDHKYMEALAFVQQAKAHLEKAEHDLWERINK